MSNVSSDKRIDELCDRVLKHARDSVIINMRFLDTAFARLGTRKNEGVFLPYCDGQRLCVSPREVLRITKNEKAYAQRLYLHVIFHLIFSHPYSSNRINSEYFDLACDIATEAVVLSLDIKALSMIDDNRRQEKLKVFRKYIDKLTAQSIYKYFLANEPSRDGLMELKELFVFDDHRLWHQESMDISLNEWKKLSERIKADLKTFSKNQNKSEGLSENLEEATKDHYNYNDILKRFCVMGEDMKVNDEEFDYIYYTYGLSLYKNIPLVEPLEYKDTRKIKEFVIVLDTSASCQGNIVRSFLNKTYSILKSSENYFSSVNIHIIQCDNAVQSDVKITDDESFEYFIKNGKLTGFGGTDFRPAFEYVDKLIEDGVFSNLKGLIYFTDGYGIYPANMPSYDAMFVFLDEDDNRAELPPWAIKVVIDDADLNDTKEKLGNRDEY